jgi:hypothetical protein
VSTPTRCGYCLGNRKSRLTLAGSAPLNLVRAARRGATLASTGATDSTAERIADRTQDTMAFTGAGPNHGSAPVTRICAKTRPISA